MIMDLGLTHLVIISCFLFIPGVIATEPRGPHSILTEQLLTNYGPISCRPVSDVRNQIDVEIDLEVVRVIDLNERHQTLQQSAFLNMNWHDDYLTWNATEYPNVNVLIIPTDQIWRPDIHLFENVDRNFESFKDVGAWVFPDGTVVWVAPVILYTSCRIDARLFPFDTQRCSLRFGSWSYNNEQLNLKPLNRTEGVGKYFTENGVWRLENILVRTIINEYTEGQFPEVVYTVLLQRQPLFHVFSFIVPCALLSMMNLLAFVLPTASGEKVSLGITNLLALVLFQQLIADSLPPSSSDMPIISYYFTPMILIGCLSIVSGVFVAALYHQENNKPVPGWLLKLTRLHPLMTNLNAAHLKAEPNVYDEVTNLPADVTETGVRNNTIVTSNVRRISIAYSVEGKRGVVTDDYLHSHIGYTADWRKVAAVIDNLILIVGIVLTISAVTATSVLFATAKDEA